MNPWVVLAWFATAGFAAGLVAALTWVLVGSREFGSRKDRKNTRGERASGFSIARYQVMGRVLASQDMRFLSTQPGLHPRAVARWKRDGLRIFRLYLGELTRDFFALHAHARRLLVESHSESPEFASTLVRQQAAFWRARLALEGRLLLFKFGMGSVDVAPLLQMIEAMRVDLFRLMPEPAQAL